MYVYVCIHTHTHTHTYEHTLQAFPTSIDEDEAWLTQQEAGQLAAINKRHAVLARLSEKKILRHAVTLLHTPRVPALTRLECMCYTPRVPAPARG